MNFMKHTFLLIAILFSLSFFAQERKGKYDYAFSPEVISQKDFFGGINLLIGKVVNEKMIIGMSGVRIGAESNFKNNSEFIIAPKVGFETSGTIFVMRLNAVNYFQDRKSDFRILPEIGLSWAGVINLTYGYNIRLTNSLVEDINKHRFSLSINLNRKLIKEGLPRM
jgi:hypothetical protein